MRASEVRASDRSHQAPPSKRHYLWDPRNSNLLYATPIGFCQVIFAKPLEMRFNLTCQKKMKTWQNPTFAKWYLANRWTCSQVAKYVRWGRVFAKLPYFAKSFAKLLEECFKRFCQKSRMPTPFAKLLEMLSVKATLSLPHLFTDL